MPMLNRRTDQLKIVALVFIGLLPFVNLLGLPPFIDEACQMWRVERAAEAGEWLRAFRIGKPLDAWLPVPLVWAGADTFTVMRVLHTTAGLVCVLISYVLTARFASRSTAFASALLVAVCPFIVFYQRLALAEIYLCAAGMLTLLCAIYFWQKNSWKSAIYLSVCLVLAAFAKFPIGFVFVLSVPLAWLFMTSDERTDLTSVAGRQKLLVVYAPVLLVLCTVIAVVLVRWHFGLWPGFGLQNISEQTQATNRLATFAGNLSELLTLFTVQVTLPVTVLTVIGVIFALLRGNRYLRWVTIMGGGPLLGMMLGSSVWYARYLVFTIPPLTIGAVCGWQLILRRTGRVKGAMTVVLLIASVVLMGHQSALIILDPPNARGLGGYVRGWTSGYGYPELARYLQSEPDTPSEVYFLEICPAMQLRALLPDEWAKRVRQIQLVDGRYLSRAEQEAHLTSNAPVWLITPGALDDQNDFSANHLRRLAGFSKPRSETQVTLYEVTN